MAGIHRLATYSPKKVNISFAGTSSVVGWVSLAIDRNSDNTATSLGADGTVAHTVIADDTGTFELTVLQQNSEVNLIIAGLQAKDNAESDITYFDVVVSDKSGGVLCYLDDCHLRKVGSQDLAAEAGERAHSFHVDNVRYVALPEGISESATAVANASAAIDAISSLSDLKKII